MALTANTASYITTATATAALVGSTVSLTTLTASNIQVENLHVTNITSSVVYSSGSNTFGNSLSNVQQFTGSVRITGSLTVDGPVTIGEIVGTASWANNAVTTSYVAWANVHESNTDTFLGTASFVTYTNVGGIDANSQFAGTASFATTAATALVANTASYIAWANVHEDNTSIFLGTASFVNYDTGVSPSVLNTSQFAGTASFAVTASYIDGGVFP